MMRKTFLFSLLTLLIISVHQYGLGDSAKPQFNESNSYFVFSPDSKYLVKVFHTSNGSWVRVHETNEMKMLTQWEIPDFKAHTVRFSLKEPSKLLIADKNRLLVYRLTDDGKQLLFLQPKKKGQEIVQAYFNKDNDEIVWATKSAVYKTDTNKKSQKEVLRVPWGEGKIKSVAASGEKELAVNLEESKNILLLSPDNKYEPYVLTGHKKPIVGLQSMNENQLISLDEDYQLVIWNTSTRDIKKKVTLAKPSEEAGALGFTIDDPQKHLSVISQAKNEAIGQSYLISDLEQGKVDPETLPMTITSSGNVYSSVSSFVGIHDEKEPKEEKPVSNWQPPPPKKKINTLYDLAKIEAEHGEYQAALELIKKIPLDDPEYGESRALKRKVFDAINAQNIVTAAREQMNKGNYKSAKILLEKALVKNPDSELVSRQLKQIEEKLDDNTWIKIIVVLFLLLLGAALGYVVWRYQTSAKNRTKSASAKASMFFGLGGKKSTKDDEKQDLRHRFVYKLDETRKMLNQAAAKDSDRRFKNTWMEITARLNTIEKRAKLSDKFLGEFLSELEKVQQTIEKLGLQGRKKTGFQFEEEDNNKSHQSNQKKTNNQQSNKSQKKPKETKIPDYFKILGVNKNATLDDVKKAYRRKMKDYHPDRHNASDFNWVKEEADKRTKEVQEAYLKLSEIMK